MGLGAPGGVDMASLSCAILAPASAVVTAAASACAPDFCDSGVCGNMDGGSYQGWGVFL